MPPLQLLAHCAGKDTLCNAAIGVAFVLIIVSTFWALKRAERKAQARAEEYHRKREERGLPR